MKRNNNNRTHTNRLSNVRSNDHVGPKLELGPILHETVEEKRVERRHSPSEEFGEFTRKQRNAVIQLNKERRKRAIDASNAGNTNQYNNVSTLDAETLRHIIASFKPPIMTYKIRIPQAILLALVCHFMKAIVIPRLPLLVKSVSISPM